MGLRAGIVEERKATQGHGRMHGGPSPVTPKGNKNALKRGSTWSSDIFYSGNA
jgi:hypothetical protein